MDIKFTDDEVTFFRCLFAVVGGYLLINKPLERMGAFFKKVEKLLRVGRFVNMKNKNRHCLAAACSLKLITPHLLLLLLSHCYFVGESQRLLGEYDPQEDKED